MFVAQADRIQPYFFKNTDQVWVPARLHFYLKRDYPIRVAVNVPPDVVSTVPTMNNRKFNIPAVVHRDINDPDAQSIVGVTGYPSGKLGPADGVNTNIGGVFGYCN